MNSKHLNSQAFWISPQGDIHVVPQTHLRMIADQPSLFGFEKSAVDEVFRRYGETPNVEGYAREELIRVLFSQGWIRIRYCHGDHFDIQCDSDLPLTYQNIDTFIRFLVPKYPATSFSSLSILDPDGVALMTTSITEFTAIAIENDSEPL